MAYFPMCVDLSGRDVLLIGNGPQIVHKAEKLRPFCVKMIHRDVFRKSDLTADTALVVIGDTAQEEAARISAVCKTFKIPVNVVDMPDLSTFFFPAIIAEGDLTVSVSTGGRAPGAAAFLARKIKDDLPGRTEEIMDWLCGIRQRLYGSYPKENARMLLSRLTKAAFDLGRPLTDSETDEIIG